MSCQTGGGSAVWSPTRWTSPDATYTDTEYAYDSMNNVIRRGWTVLLSGQTGQTGRENRPLVCYWGHYQYDIKPYDEYGNVPTASRRIP